MAVMPKQSVIMQNQGPNRHVSILTVEIMDDLVT